MLLSLLVDRTLFGFASGWYHLHSLLWHLAAIWLAWMLLRRWLEPFPVMIGLALFAVHPLQTEAVLFVAARNDPMAAVLLCSALLCLCKDKPSLLLAALATAAAALCKESVYLAPLLYAAVEVARTGRPGKLKGHLAMVAGVGLVLAIRFMLGIGFPAGTGLSHVASVALPSTAFYFERLLVPIGLVPGLNLNWQHITPWWALLCGTGVLGVILWFGRREALGGILFAGASLAPAFSAIATTGSVPDRYMYFPLIGGAMAVAACLRSPALHKLPVALGLWGILAILTTMTLHPWKDDRTMWTAVHAQYQTPYTAGHLAREIELSGDLPGSVELYRLGVSPPKPFIEACFSIAQVNFKLGDMPATIRDGKAALDNGCPPVPEILAPVSMALALEGQWDEAEAFAKSMDSDPFGYGIVIRVAAALRRGDRGPMEEAIADNPDSDPALLQAAVRRLIGDNPGSANALERAGPLPDGGEGQQEAQEEDPGAE
jgi:hypothetical protein